MIVGFNHNITYRGVCFHVQTEDSGIKTPHLITLLYHGGTIICSQKTSYADILNVGDLDRVVEDLAKEQHKGMLRRLKKGEFDERIVAYGIGLKSLSESAEPAVVEAPADDVPGLEPAVEPVSPADQAEPVASETAKEEINAKEPQASSPEKPSSDLDDLIFSYLSVEDEED